MVLVAENTLWGPQHGFAVVGKSGGIGRPADDSVVGHCDPIAEREGAPENLLIFGEKRRHESL